MILVNNQVNNQKFYVKNPNKISFWKNLANNSESIHVKEVKQ